MNALVSLLISVQCHGNAICKNYLTSCATDILLRWNVSEYQDRTAKAKVAISVCEKKYVQDEKWD
jgi:hypothetical protein